MVFDARSLVTAMDGQSCHGGKANKGRHGRYGLKQQHAARLRHKTEAVPQKEHYHGKEQQQLSRRKLYQAVCR
jgi:hypothetical protein